MNNKNKKNQADARRYPRIFLPKDVLDFNRIAGIEAKWPSDYVTGVVDISYIGASIVKPSKVIQKFHKGEQVKFLFSFANGEKDVLFDAEVIRSDEKSLAVHFASLSLKARKCLEEFLKVKIIGLNTKLVDSKYYVKEQGFNLWYHGPNQTNVFIWGDLGEIKKATFELNNEVLTFENDKFYLSESKNFLQVPTEDYSHNVNNPETKALLKAKAVKKVGQDIVSLLSQIEDTSGIIKQLSVKMILALDKNL